MGCAGLGAKVRDSGLSRWTGRIPKSGRRGMRRALVEAANSAARSHQHWRSVLARLEPRLGSSKAIVAIARKLLMAVWHVLTKACADRFADPLNVARAFFGLAYDIGARNLPDGLTGVETRDGSSTGPALAPS